ncbi:glycosyltransferase family 4 protein [Polycladidibacter hongkongensis]|uniref:glycosyltransferase family 4 protein n=1 Tax=Polycladidibacter hongkongensis TaxID=1647556 RepID=UPI000A75882E|nr:glycosyltransferase family 4 protein [Pseudovibrio hongkongensis]
MPNSPTLAQLNSPAAQGKGHSRTILQIVPDLQTGGAERTTVDMAEAIIAKGWRALVVSQGGRMVPELEALGAQHITLPAKSKKPWVILQNAKRLREICKRESVDLIHARSRAPAWSARITANKLGLPFVTTYHGIYKQTNALKAWYNSVMTRADCVIANSLYTESLILQRDHSATGKTQVVYRGTDVDAFARQNVSKERAARLRERWGLDENARVILTIARITGWKGHKCIIEAAKELFAKGAPKELTFVFAGDAQGRDAYLEELEALIKAEGLSENIKLVGHCADVPAALCLAELSVVASIEPEAFGRAAVEAQAAGVPVIVSDIGAVPETVLVPPQVTEGARTGWHFPVGDSSNLAACISTALAMMPKERQALAERAYQHVRSSFTKSQMCAQTLAIYEKLLNQTT